MAIDAGYETRDLAGPRSGDGSPDIRGPIRFCTEISVHKRMTCLISGDSSRLEPGLELNLDAATTYTQGGLDKFIE